MRVRATALGSAESNAIGQVELSCTPAGLAVGMYGVGAYSEGYATGALTSGTRFTVPYSGILSAREQGEQLCLELDSPGFPHSKLVLNRFTAGPGVPPTELRKRRMILHFSALSIAAIACLAATMLAPRHASQTLAWGALGYGAIAGAIVLAFGFSLDQSLFVRAPGEDATRRAFLSDFEQYYPRLLRTDQAPKAKKRKKPLPDLSSLLPRTATAVGITLAATILTALVTGQRLLMDDDGARTADRSNIEPDPAEFETSPEPLPPPAEPPTVSGGLAPPVLDDPTEPANAEPAGDQAAIERRCLCDRADSQLWKNPIPRLSAILVEKRAIPLKNYVRTQAKIAVVNNGDSPISEITLHVQFYETRGKSRKSTKERPLYFEGPLRPGEAIKWTTEARGTEFEVAVPELGTLGPNGDGAAPVDTFMELLKANHRPVRLHAARLLSYLGDTRARDAALHLKDAMRAAEAPYLRRILSATGDVRVCDIELRKDKATTVGACVYNASDADLEGLGVQLNALNGSLDADHPLADPPEIRSQAKWQLPGKFKAQSGRYARVPLPDGFLSEKGSSLEVVTDRFDLLD